MILEDVSGDELVGAAVGRGPATGPLNVCSSCTGVSLHTRPLTSLDWPLVPVVPNLSLPGLATRSWLPVKLSIFEVISRCTRHCEQQCSEARPWWWMTSMPRGSSMPNTVLKPWGRAWHLITSLVARRVPVYTCEHTLATSFSLAWR